MSSATTNRVLKLFGCMLLGTALAGIILLVSGSYPFDRQAVQEGQDACARMFARERQRVGAFTDPAAPAPVANRETDSETCSKYQHRHGPAAYGVALLAMVAIGGGTFKRGSKRGS